MDVLQLDVSGRPQAWLSAKEAAVLYANDSVAWTLGDPFLLLRGGIQRRTGVQSRLELHPIVAVHGAIPLAPGGSPFDEQREAVCLRDRQMCAYCGGVFSLDELTRAHAAVFTWRGRLVDELHHGLPQLQQPQRQPHTQ